jgi:hypothetical protein
MNLLRLPIKLIMSNTLIDHVTAEANPVSQGLMDFPKISVMFHVIQVYEENDKRKLKCPSAYHGTSSDIREVDHVTAVANQVISL